MLADKTLEAHKKYGHLLELSTNPGSNAIYKLTRYVKCWYKATQLCKIILKVD